MHTDVYIYILFLCRGSVSIQIKSANSAITDSIGFYIFIVMCSKLYVYSGLLLRRVNIIDIHMYFVWTCTSKKM